jgi:hypothetical protein
MAARSHFISAVDSIDNMSVHAIPAKPLKNVTAIRIDRTVVLVDQKGRVYSTQPTGNFAIRPDDNHASIRQTIIGAARLGAISKKAMEQDLQIRQAAALEREKRHAASMIVAHANSLGIKFTEAQRRRIDSAQPRTKGGA